MFDRSSDLRGLLVVSKKEGAQLGIVSGIQLDTATKHIAAFRYRRRKRFGGDEFFVPVDAVDSIGRDVVMISSEELASKQTEAARAPGRSLKDLQGVWVTSLDGRHVGALVDVEFDPDDWGITELILAEDKRLPVDRDEIEIGDEILVPIAYRERVEEVGEEKPGFLRRAFGGEAIEDMKKALGRALKRTKSEEKAGV